MKEQRIFNAAQIPDSHKIAVYDALCRHLEQTIDSYFTTPVPVDPRYDSGIEPPTETTVIGVEVEDGALYVAIDIIGWVDPQAFYVALPTLTRDAHTGDSAGIIPVSLPTAPDGPRLEETRAPLTLLGLNNDLSEARAALDAERVASNRMRAALFAAQEALGRGDADAASAAIRRGLGET